MPGRRRGSYPPSLTDPDVSRWAYPARAVEVSGRVRGAQCVNKLGDQKPDTLQPRPRPDLAALQPLVLPSCPAHQMATNAFADRNDRARIERGQAVQPAPQDRVHFFGEVIQAPSRPSMQPPGCNLAAHAGQLCRRHRGQERWKIGSGTPPTAACRKAVSPRPYFQNLPAQVRRICRNSSYPATLPKTGQESQSCLQRGETRADAELPAQSRRLRHRQTLRSQIPERRPVLRAGHRRLAVLPVPPCVGSLDGAMPQGRHAA